MILVIVVHTIWFKKGRCITPSFRHVLGASYAVYPALLSPFLIKSFLSFRVIFHLIMEMPKRGRPRKTDGDEKQSKRRETMRRLYSERKRKKDEGEDEEEERKAPGRPKDDEDDDGKRKRQERNARYYQKKTGVNILKVKIVKKQKTNCDANDLSPSFSPVSILKSKVKIT